MKSGLSFVLLVSLHAFSPGYADGLGSNWVAGARLQASNSLIAFQKLITPTNYKLMGFNSSNEIAAATLQPDLDPLLIYTIPENSLRGYQQGDEMSSLLRPTSRALVPIFVGSNVRSSTTVRRDPGGWVTANWGQPKLIREVWPVYKTIHPSMLLPNTSPFLVEVPKFNLWFVGYSNTQSALVLRSTVNLQLGPININENQVFETNAMYRLATMAQQPAGRSN